MTQTRLRIGMVFQRPNPFPSMTIAQNVLSGLRLSGIKVPNPDALVRECLERAGLWKETRNRLNESGAALSGGQLQRLCIARSLAVRPRVLLMDEPCSALDPISTSVIEETIRDLSEDITIVIVTHNMQQAQRVSHNCALFLVDGEGLPGHIVEAGPTERALQQSHRSRARLTTSTGGSDDGSGHDHHHDPATAVALGGAEGARPGEARCGATPSRGRGQRSRWAPCSPWSSSRTATP